MVQDGYPVVLRIRGASCVVVGGGRAAAGKIGPLLAAGARVTVISPEVDEAIAVLAEDGKLTVIGRAYGGANDLRGAVLAFAATDRDDVNEAVCRDAATLGIPVCDTGRPERGTFLLPAVMRRGKLTMAVSTSGASPALARKIRDELREAYGPEYGEALDFLAEIRRLIREKVPDPAERSALLKELAERDVIGLAREGRLAFVRRRLLADLEEAETAHMSRWRRMLDFSGERPSTGEMEK
jgi:precorrin-2 dehydrogenase/sirohydrochlorin ferrochelatase